MRFIVQGECPYNWSTICVDYVWAVFSFCFLAESMVNEWPFTRISDKPNQGCYSLSRPEEKIRLILAQN